MFNKLEALSFDPQDHCTYDKNKRPGSYSVMPHHCHNLVSTSLELALGGCSFPGEHLAIINLTRRGSGEVSAHRSQLSGDEMSLEELSTGVGVKSEFLGEVETAGIPSPPWATHATVSGGWGGEIEEHRGPAAHFFLPSFSLFSPPFELFKGDFPF